MLLTRRQPRLGAAGRGTGPGNCDNCHHVLSVGLRIPGVTEALKPQRILPVVHVGLAKFTGSVGRGGPPRSGPHHSVIKWSDGGISGLIILVMCPPFS